MQYIYAQNRCVENKSKESVLHVYRLKQLDGQQARCKSVCDVCVCVGGAGCERESR